MKQLLIVAVKAIGEGTVDNPIRPQLVDVLDAQVGWSAVDRDDISDDQFVVLVEPNTQH